MQFLAHKKTSAIYFTCKLSCLGKIMKPPFKRPVGEKKARHPNWRFEAQHSEAATQMVLIGQS
jgi:hypothetical protein